VREQALLRLFPLWCPLRYAEASPLTGISIEGSHLVAPKICGGWPDAPHGQDPGNIHRMVRPSSTLFPEGLIRRASGCRLQP